MHLAGGADGNGLAKQGPVRGLSAIEGLAPRRAVSVVPEARSGEADASPSGPDPEGREARLHVCGDSLAAAQLLPFGELLLASQRFQDYSAVSVRSMPPWGWANLLVPLFRCWRSPPGVFFQSLPLNATSMPGCTCPTNRFSPRWRISWG